MMFPRTAATPETLRAALADLVDLQRRSTKIESAIVLGVRPADLKDELAGLIQLLEKNLVAIQGLIPNTADGLFTLQPKLAEARKAGASLSVSMALGLNADRAFKRFNLALAEVKWVLDLLDIAGSVNTGQNVGQQPVAVPPQRDVTPQPAAPVVVPGAKPKVFVVHGRDLGAEQEVARTIERLGCEAVLLHEQENLSRTIIEKLEEHSNVQYAVVLLTPDDLGTETDAPDELRPRSLSENSP